MTKDDAETYVKAKISQIESMQKSLKDNYYDMDLENADVQTKIEDAVARAYFELSKLKSELEALKFEETDQLIEEIVILILSTKFFETNTKSKNGSFNSTFYKIRT